MPQATSWRRRTGASAGLHTEFSWASASVWIFSGLCPSGTGILQTAHHAAFRRTAQRRNARLPHDAPTTPQGCSSIRLESSPHLRAPSRRQHTPQKPMSSLARPAMQTALAPLKKTKCPAKLPMSHSPSSGAPRRRQDRWAEGCPT